METWTFLGYLKQTHKLPPDIKTFLRKASCPSGRFGPGGGPLSNKAAITAFREHSDRDMRRKHTAMSRSNSNPPSRVNWGCHELGQPQRLVFLGWPTYRITLIVNLKMGLGSHWWTATLLIGNHCLLDISGYISVSCSIYPTSPYCHQHFSLNHYLHH